jgi:hypothetical protein
MNAGLVLAEQIKWWDALDSLRKARGKIDVEKGLQGARECSHPDALWLSSLFPAGVDVSRDRMCEVMEAQGDDARALFLRWKIGDRDSREQLVRAAEKGYAPAQAELSLYSGDETECFRLAQRASDQGDRDGVFQLAHCYMYSIGCRKEDRNKAMVLFERAAELQHAQAQVVFATCTYDTIDWRRFQWLALASARGDSHTFRREVVRALSAFLKGKLGRILHIVAPVIRRGLDASRRTLFGADVDGEKQVKKLLRVVALHDAMLVRAGRAVRCWSAVGLRCGLVKDVRVMIAKKAWEEVWLWASATEGAVHEVEVLLEEKQEWKEEEDVEYDWDV